MTYPKLSDLAKDKPETVQTETRFHPVQYSKLAPGEDDNLVLNSFIKGKRIRTYASYSLQGRTTSLHISVHNPFSVMKGFLLT